MKYLNKEMEDAGWRRYHAQKADREKKGLGGAPSLDLSQLERKREIEENGKKKVLSKRENWILRGLL